MTDTAPQPFTYDTPPEPYRNYRVEAETNPEVLSELGKRVTDLAEADLATKGLMFSPDHRELSISPFLTEETHAAGQLQIRVIGYAVPITTKDTPS